MMQLVDILAAGVADNSGVLLGSGTVTVYRAGTATKITPYQDYEATTPHSNPLTLDSAGRADVWVDERVKLLIKNSAGSTIRTIDDVGASDQDIIETVQDAVLIRDVVNVVDYGAVGDGSTDDTEAIELAITAATTLRNDSENVALCFPYRAVSYKITSAITIPHYIDVIMDSPINYVGSSNICAVTIGTTAIANTKRNLKLWVLRETQSDWTSESNIGVKLLNIHSSSIDVVAIERFTINLLTQADASTGVHYNRCYLGALMYGKVGLDIDSITSGANNENTFYKGRFGVGIGVNPTLNRYAIRIHSSDGTYTTNNNNHFYSPSFELGRVQQTGTITATSDTITSMNANTNVNVGDEILHSSFPKGTTVLAKPSSSSVQASVAATASASGATIGFLRSVCVYAKHATRNRVIGARCEDNNLIMLTENSSDRNEVDVLYDNSNWDLLDRASYLNFVTGFQKQSSAPIMSQYKPYLVWCIEDMRQQMGPQATSGYGFFPGASWANSSNATVKHYSSNAVTQNTSSISFTLGDAVGTMVDTSTFKRFVMCHTGGSLQGRLIIRCYDSGGTVLDSSGSGHPYVRTPSGDAVAYSASWGKVYQSGSDSSSDGMKIFEVGEAVKSIWVGIGKGSSNAELKSMHLFCLDQGCPRAYPGHSTHTLPFAKGDGYWSDGAPAGGTWPKGFYIKNDTPSVGNPKGWICTTAGTPGTWTSTGNL